MIHKLELQILKEILGSNYDFLVKLCREKGYTKVTGLFYEEV